jgi:hypothetical protein
LLASDGRHHNGKKNNGCGSRDPWGWRLIDIGQNDPKLIQAHG